MAMTTIEAWRARGKLIDTLDGRVWTGSAGGDANASASAIPVLVLHGFPTSSWEFAPLVDLLAPRRRVVFFDFLGYGLSEKPREFGYSLMEQADVVVEVSRAFNLEKVHLFAHDMGTSVATELLARAERSLLPFDLASFTL